MARKNKPLPSFECSGWTIAKCPTTFAEEFAWEAFAQDNEGYCVKRVGFQTKKAAIAYCNANIHIA